MKILTRRNILTLFLLTGAIVLLIFSTQSRVFATQAVAKEETSSSAVGLNGYDIDIFARGNKSYYNPDSVEVAGKYVYVGYQNTTAPDGSDGKSSTIVQYTRSGRVVYKYQVLGRNDGLRYDPYTHQLWATCNEDGNARLNVINVDTHKVTLYLFPSPAPHGGGFDDLAFINGMAFAAASNPTLNSQGINVAPAVDKVVLSNGKIQLTPVLYGNATALDTTTNQQVQLNLTDPDSMTIDPQGDLVLVSQADAELVFLHNPGTAQQTITRIPLGTQADDTLWIPASSGHLLIADSSHNTIYRVYQNFKSGTVYTEAPSDSGVASFVGTVTLSTGTITPVMIGFGSPTGLAFLPDENN